MQMLANQKKCPLNIKVLKAQNQQLPTRQMA